MEELDQFLFYFEGEEEFYFPFANKAIKACEQL